MRINWCEPYFDEQERNALISCWDSNRVTQGPKVLEFEKQLELLFNRPAVVVSNGTVALELLWKYMGIRPGDEIIVPAMTYFASVSSFMRFGAIPVFCEVNNFLNLEPELLRRLITNRTKAILYVDFGGIPADFDIIKRVAGDIPVVLDGAHSMGTIYKTMYSIGYPDYATTSFHLAKNITTIEGGAIFANDKEKLKSLRSQGEKGTYNHEYIGTNARMTDLQASIGLIQLQKFNKIMKERKRVLNTYKKSLNMLDAHGNSCFFATLITENRNEIWRKLHDAGIDTRICYAKAIYHQKAYCGGYHLCNNAEKLANLVLQLPIYPTLTDEQINEIVGVING